jgi:anti-sigma B factor antagonist
MVFDPSAGRARLRITRTRTDTVLRLDLAGELDLSTVQHLRQAITAAFTEPGITTMLLDLAELAFLDSVGMGALIAGYKRALAAGVGFRVVNPRGAPLRALHITALDRVFVGPDPTAAAGTTEGT